METEVDATFHICIFQKAVIFMIEGKVRENMGTGLAKIFSTKQVRKSSFYGKKQNLCHIRFALYYQFNS